MAKRIIIDIEEMFPSLSKNEWAELTFNIEDALQRSLDDREYNMKATENE